MTRTYCDRCLNEIPAEGLQSSRMVTAAAPGGCVLMDRKQFCYKCYLELRAWWEARKS